MSRRTAPTRVAVAGYPHTEQNPQRGTYMIEAMHSFTYAYSNHTVQLPPFTNPTLVGFPPPAVYWFDSSNGYDCYNVPVDLQLQVQGAQMDSTGQIATVNSCSAPISVSLAFTPPVPAYNAAPPVVWSGGTPVDNLHVTVPCAADTNVTVTAAIKQKSGITALLQPQVTVKVQPGVTLDRSKLVTGAGGQVTTTATSTVAANGTYTWEIIATQPGDDATVATLPSPPPSCTGQASCAITLQASANGGKATLRAHFKAGTNDVTADARVIVVQVSRVDAVVADNLDAGNVTQGFTTQVAAGPLQWPANLWTPPNALVLVGGSVATITLNATTTPPASDPDVAAAVAFDPSHQAPDDAIGRNTPSVTVSFQGSAVLNVNASGSFQVLAYIDANGNGQWDPGETGVTVPLIMVRATVNQNLSAAPNRNVLYVRNPTTGQWESSYLQAGGPPCQLDYQGPCAIQLVAEVDLVGGGQDGRRGVDQVFAGWAQDLNYPNGSSGAYQSNHAATEVFASNVPPPPHDPQTFYPAGAYSPGGADPDPVILPGPLLDSSAAAPGMGGNSSLLSIQAYTDAGANPALGKRKLVTALDWTHSGLLAMHPINGTSALTQVQYNLDFNSFLVLWSSISGVPDATGTPPPTADGPVTAERTYAVLLQQPWSIRSTFSVDAAGNGALTAPPGPGITLGIPSCAPIACAALPLAGTAAVLTAPSTCTGAGPGSPCTLQNADAMNYKH